MAKRNQDGYSPPRGQYTDLDICRNRFTRGLVFGVFYGAIAIIIYTIISIPEIFYLRFTNNLYPLDLRMIQILVSVTMPFVIIFYDWFGLFGSLIAAVDSNAAIIAESAFGSNTAVPYGPGLHFKFPWESIHAQNVIDMQARTDEATGNNRLSIDALDAGVLVARTFTYNPSLVNLVNYYQKKPEAIHNAMTSTVDGAISVIMSNLTRTEARGSQSVIAQLVAMTIGSDRSDVDDDGQALDVVRQELSLVIDTLNWETADRGPNNIPMNTSREKIINGLIAIIKGSMTAGHSDNLLEDNGVEISSIKIPEIVYTQAEQDARNSRATFEVLQQGIARQLGIAGTTSSEELAKALKKIQESNPDLYREAITGAQLVLKIPGVKKEIHENRYEAPERLIKLVADILKEFRRPSGD